MRMKCKQCKSPLIVDPNDMDLRPYCAYTKCSLYLMGIDKAKNPCDRCGYQMMGNAPGIGLYCAYEGCGPTEEEREAEIAANVKAFADDNRVVLYQKDLGHRRQEAAIKYILKERERQEEKWGEQNHHPLEWLGILMEEIGEMSKEINENDKDKYKTELVQVAAVAFQMIESFDRGDWA